MNDAEVAEITLIRIIKESKEDVNGTGMRKFMQTLEEYSHDSFVDTKGLVAKTQVVYIFADGSYISFGPVGISPNSAWALSTGIWLFDDQRAYQNAPSTPTLQ